MTGHRRPVLYHASRLPACRAAGHEIRRTEREFTVEGRTALYDMDACVQCRYYEAREINPELDAFLAAVEEAIERVAPRDG
jgi:hypothetical protein